MKAASATDVSDYEPVQNSQSNAEPLPQNPNPTPPQPARTGAAAPTADAASISTATDATEPITPEAGAEALWAGVIDFASQSVRMQSLLQKGKPIAWENNSLVLEVEGASRSVLERQTSEIESLLRKVAGKKITLIVRAAEVREATTENAEAQIDPVDLAKQEPLVQHAIKVFHGQVETAFVRTAKSPKP